MSLNFSFDTLTKKSAPQLQHDLVYDHLIVGGGPAALSSALYALRKGLTTGIIAANIGGQLLNTSIVDNYLGISEIGGEQLGDKFYEHVVELNAHVTVGISATAIQKANGLFEVKASDGHTYKAKTLLIATGSNPRKLEVKGESEFTNKGVAYCAICDAPLFKDKTVIIAGGGNSAVEAAIDVAKWAKDVIVVHRSEFRADKILLDRMFANDNITVFKQTQILEITGDVMMNGVVVLDKETNQSRTIHADGIFIEIGNIPNSGLVQDFVALNEFNEVMVDNRQMTNIEGCFSAGDVSDAMYKQIIVSVADGAKAALNANDYINHHF
ncbi:MAG: FAD-dependent oxidoreductase [Erysipelothrix sp.]|nr:FAD-dependent oxidoreductase [Erysipelothrix sp.]